MPGAPTGLVTLGGIPFNIKSNSMGFEAWSAQVAADGGNAPVSVTIAVGVYGVTNVYTLINSMWGVPGPSSDASLVFTGSAGTNYTYPLVGNSNIRNWVPGGDGPTAGITAPTTNVYSGPAYWAGYTGVLDMQHIFLPAAFSTQTLTSVQLIDNGSTGVQRTAIDGVTVVSSTTLAPSFADEPVSQTNVVGGSVTFTVGVTGAEPLSYQWSFDNNPIPSATNATYSIASIQASNGGSYTVVITNAYGMTNATATLTVATPPSNVIIFPASQTVFEGVTASFTATASGTIPLAYQWALNGTNIAAATNSTLTLTDVQQSAAGSYSVITSNLYGAASNAFDATLSVLTFTATHTSLAYGSPGICTVSCQVRYAFDQSLLVLVFEPAIPNGWTLQSVNGPGSPEIDNWKIAFDVTGLSNPVNFSYTMTVPSGETGPQSITNNVLYLLSGMTATSNYLATPNPLVVTHGATITQSVSGDQLSLAVFGDSGSNFVLQSSADLISWTNITTNVPVNGVFEINLPIISSKMFYRTMLGR